MANPQHVQWLREGREAWNERRNVDDLVPDLSESRWRFPESLDGYNLERSDLRNADFFGVQVARANLANSNLSGLHADGSRFNDAVLGGSDLTGARLHSVDFRKSILQRADLTGADLRLADLSDADLRFAKVDGARMESATLCRTNAIGARLWQARLYPSVDFEAEGGDPVISSIAELLEEIRKIENDGKTYFRGEKRCGWKLAPSLYREDLASCEERLLTDLMVLRPEEFDRSMSAFEQLQIAQHYGLSTRLLDVTRNPLVALFFAAVESDDAEDGRIHVLSFPRDLIKPFSSDTISVIAGFAKLSETDKRWLLSRDGLHPQQPWSWRYNFQATTSRLLEIIRQEKPYLEDRIDTRHLYGVFVVEPQQRDERVVAQSAAFLLSAFRERFDFPRDDNWNSGARAYGHRTLRVAGEAKEHLRRDLELMGITRQSLFPGLDTSAEEVMRQFRPRNGN